jgi:hypothetical protein
MPHGKRIKSSKEDKHTRERMEKLIRQQSKEADALATYKQEYSALRRDIVHQFDPSTINWDRRLACKHNFKLACETYFKGIFYSEWSKDQLYVLETLQDIFIDQGLFAIVMPRGGGKTALCRASLMWGCAYGHKQFPYLIGSKQDKAKQSLNVIKLHFYTNTLLAEDFPEICTSVKKLSNRAHGAAGQTFMGVSTHIEWGALNIRLPSLQFDDETAEMFLRHDPESMIKVEETGTWIAKSSGINVACNGIDGSIRGEAEAHPILLSQPRPDVVLLDDVQKDQKADSPIAVQKLVDLIDGAVAGLAGPGRHISGMMPCTIASEGDAAAIYTDRQMKPEWRGKVFKMVQSWPPGITDTEMTLETEEGRLWNKYGEIRREALIQDGNFKKATAFYKKNRKKMDKDFKCSWETRYDDRNELSAQQHAMNLRFKNPATFAAEYQAVGKTRDPFRIFPIDLKSLIAKQAPTKRLIVPKGAQYLVSFIDIQDEILYYITCALEQDYTGVVIDYGTFPELPSKYFTNLQAIEWNLLSNKFFEVYPDLAKKATRTASGKRKAPIDAKIYWALAECHKYITNKVYMQLDPTSKQRYIDRLAIDIRWGKAQEGAKRFISDIQTKTKSQRVLAYQGRSLAPHTKQFEEYTRTKGWLFENEKDITIKQVKWCLKPSIDGTVVLDADVDRLKDFLIERLATPAGGKGSLSLYADTADKHTLLGTHILESEFPEEIQARGRKKNKWMIREGKPDNHWLDGLAGCMALGGLLGCCLNVTGHEETKTPKKLRISDRWAKT